MEAIKGKVNAVEETLNGKLLCQHLGQIETLQQLNTKLMEEKRKLKSTACILIDLAILERWTGDESAISRG
jgi:hypothetical protein